jgi:small subunit ribosomal protein S6
MAQKFGSMADEPGTQREYETIFILRPETNQDGITLVNQRVRGIIDGANGRVIKLDNWGKRKLAYEVKKNTKGIYLYWSYLGNTGVVEEIERNLRLLDSVIRYYTVKVDENVDPNAKPAGIDEEAYTKAAATIPDEEALATGAAAMPRFDEEAAHSNEEFLPSTSDDTDSKDKE